MPGFSAALLLRIETDPPIRLWAGVGDFPVPADTIEAAPVVYSGLGELAGLPELDQLINGLAQRVDFQLSGVSSDIVAQAEEEAASVYGAAVNVGLLVLDADLQPEGTTRWLWDGEADVVRTNTISNTDYSKTRTISVSVGTANTDRSRANFDTYSAVNQRRRSPTDLACDFIANYDRGSSKQWG